MLAGAASSPSLASVSFWNSSIEWYFWNRELHRICNWSVDDGKSTGGNQATILKRLRLETEKESKRILGLHYRGTKDKLYILCTLRVGQWRDGKLIYVFQKSEDYDGRCEVNEKDLENLGRIELLTHES